MSRIKAVVDTNVFVSSVIKGGTPPDAVRRAWLRGDFDLCTSLPIIGEIDRVLHYSKIQQKYKLTEEEIQQVLSDLKTKAIVLPGKLVPEVIAEDPADNFFIGCALEAGAHYIVTGDQHLRRLKAYRDIQIVTPRIFADLLKGE